MHECSYKLWRVTMMAMMIMTMTITTTMMKKMENVHTFTNTSHQSSQLSFESLPSAISFQMKTNQQTASNSSSSIPSELNFPNHASEIMAIERSRWKNKAEFILVGMGAAVGPGNTWRFPYVCHKNGGGTFLIIYLAMLVLVGMPVCFLELSVGQFASLGPLSVWKFSILFKGLGFAMIATGAVIGCYYSIIVSWSLYSLYLSFTFSTPWKDCGNDWNTPYCASPDEFNNNETFVMKNNTTMQWRSELKTPTEEYFYRKVLQMSTGFGEIGTVVWQLALCLSVSWLVVFLVLVKGIHYLGKAAYFTSTFPYIMLTVMLIRGVTLEGAREGIFFYVVPDWSKIKDTNIWIDAAIQVFITLGTCTGGLMAMASYNDFHNNCFRDAPILCLINCATSICSGFAVFSIVGHLALRKNVSIHEATAIGPGLIFVIYPECLDTLPVTPLWSCLFHLMMVTLGLGSMFSMTEGFISAVADEFTVAKHQQKRKIAFRFVVCSIFCCLSLPFVTNGGFYLFHIVDSSVCGFPLLVIGLLEILSLNYVYGYDRLSEDVKLMLGHKPNVYYRVAWMVVSPLALLILTIVALNHKQPTLFSGSYLYPWKSEIMTWTVVGFLLLLLPSIGVFYYCKKGGCQVLKIISKPTDDWGPSMDENRSGRYQVKVKPTQIIASNIRKKSARESSNAPHQSKASIVRDAIFNGDVNLAVVVATDHGVVTTDEVYDMVVKGNVNQGYQGDGFKVEQRPDESDDEASVEENPGMSVENPGMSVENPDVEDPDVEDPDIKDPDVENPRIEVILSEPQLQESNASKRTPKPIARNSHALSKQDTSL